MTSILPSALSAAGLGLIKKPVKSAGVAGTVEHQMPNFAL